jgi:hypothetical protein
MAEVDAAEVDDKTAHRGFFSRHATLIAVGAILLIVLTMESVPWQGGLRVSGKVLAGSVTMLLAQDLDEEPDLELTPPIASLRGIEWLRPPTELASSLAATSSLDLSGSALRLSSVRVASKSMLTLDRTGDGFVLQVSGGGTSLRFETRGALKLKLEDRELGTTAATGDSVSFSTGASGKSAVALALRAAAKEGVRTENISVSLLRFGRRHAADGGGAAFASSVISGSVTLVDVAHTTELDRGAAIQLEGFHGHIVQLEAIPNGYALTFAGKVDKVRLGPPGFAEDLTPTTLDFLYHQSWIQMVWASALAGLVAFAKLRAWIDGKLD